MAAAETQALFEQLTILLLLAIGSHFLFRRFHQPTIIGEIAVGIVLGPSVVGNAALGPYRLVFDPTVVATLAVLGSIFLLFLIGLDFDFRAVYTPRNIAVAFGGVVLPLSGFLVAMAITFLFALTAESIGLSAVVGAFLAGSVFAGAAFRKDFSEGARHLAAVFTPIFFVSLGLQVNVPAVAAQTGLIPLAAALTV